MSVMTLEYKSYSPYYEKEESGVKPNTVRIVESSYDLRTAEAYRRAGGLVEVTITHSRPWAPLGSFTRRVTDVCQVGTVCGKEMWVISWAHDGTGHETGETA